MAQALSRRQFLSAAAAATLAAAVPARAFAQADSPRPNILFIQTDDQGPWALRLSGNPEIHTPTLDALFRQGAYLRNYFVATPVCSPSRAETMTSRYGTELGITDWIMPPRRGLQNEAELGLDSAVSTWSKVLKDAGYRTGLVGKWHLGIQDRHLPSVFGFDYFAGFREGGAPVENPPLEVNGEASQHQGLMVDLLGNYAIEFLEAHDGSQPFLLSLQFRAPHSPWLPVAEADAAPYDGLDPALPDPGVPDLDVERVKRSLREYYQSVTGVDRNVARVLEALDRLGLRENTVIVFTSDHGYNIGHHGIIHKGNASRITNEARDLPISDPRRTRPNMFDTSLRAPTCVVWPGRIEPGTEISETVTNLDWYPTLLAAAGVAPPPDVTLRGRNVLPVLDGNAAGWDNDLYGEYSQHHYTETHLRMYRTPEWKLVRDFKNPGRDELYHLAEDPDEDVNLIDAPEANAIRGELDRRIRARMEAIGDAVLMGLAEAP